jgi:hypothetical protein
MNTYSWKRFWCLRGDQFSLADNGYLSDPETKRGMQLNSQLAPLASFADCPCLVMLGEPGIGKSTEFESEVRRVQTEPVTDQQTIRIDLKEYQTDARLVADAFENDTIRNWTEGDHNLNLFFDSLDEGRLEVRNIANVLAGQFRRIEHHVKRLRLRIACRTAEWPASLEDVLKSIWGEKSVGVIELTPLRQCDVRAAAEAKNLDADSFISEIARKEAQPFAINPITLNFLLSLYAQSHTIPSTKREIYEAGCLKLCDESSQTRRDSGYFGDLTAIQRLEVASRIAAFTVFSGRSTIVTTGSPVTEPDVITIANLAGGWEKIRRDRFDVIEAHVREVLSTTLFSGRGPERIGFAHWTYAEFLAARYVTRRGMDASQICSLIFHPEDETKIVPQLAETAAWIAVFDKHVFERMMSGDPQVLLKSDVATADGDVKERLVHRLIEGFQNEELDDSDWNLIDHYHKLSHSRLASQLEPLLLDKTQNVVTRRFVTDVAEECIETGLLNALTAVVLDTSDDAHIRSQACHAVVQIGDDTKIALLRPIVLGNMGTEPNNDLRGTVLRGLWSRQLITAEELFSVLTRPQEETSVGEYQGFLLQELAKHLVPADIPAGLRWCSQQSIVGDHYDDFFNATTEIVRQSLTRLHDAEVLDAFGDYVVSRFTKHERPLIEEDAYGEISISDRRKIIAVIVKKIDDPKKYAWAFLVGRPMITIADDIEWMLEQSAISENTDERKRWADLARLRFLRSDRSQLEKVLNCREQNPIVQEVFADLLEPVDLKSEAAARLRIEYEKHLELEERSREHHEPPLLDPPPAERINASLKQFEDGDLSAWPIVNQELQLEPRSTHYELELCDDLTQFPGWKVADDGTKARILAAAKQYLSRWTSHSADWIESRVIDRADFSGYRALVLVDKLDPEFLGSLNAERWSNVAPCIIGFPTSSGLGDEAESRQQHLLAKAYRFTADVIIAAMIQLIDRENADEKSDHLHLLSRVELCWDNQLINRLVEKLQDTALKPSCAGDLLTELVSRDSIDALRIAKSLIATRSDDHTKSLAGQAAVVLWLNTHDRGWDTLWPEFVADRAFFRDVVSDVAHERRQSRRPPLGLSDEQLADLYILLSQEFPQDEDPRVKGAHFVGPRESVQYYRDNILSTLRGRGTSASCTAIERIRQALPHLQFLDWTQRSARQLMLRTSWTPLSVDQIRELTERPVSRLVRSGSELQKVILESLQRLQQRLHGETPAIRDLWDKSGKDNWRPIDENAFSDYIKRHLESELKNCGIVALREVEIRRGDGTKGERTDIYVTAMIYGPVPDTFETVRVILEVKGCWHDELQVAMETQLKNRYLKDNDCEHGIYVVGWFACDAWGKDDQRKLKVPKWQLADARTFFDSQSHRLSDDSCFLKSIVIDTSLK